MKADASLFITKHSLDRFWELNGRVIVKYINDNRLKKRPTAAEITAGRVKLSVINNLTERKKISRMGWQY